MNIFKLFKNILTIFIVVGLIINIVLFVSNKEKTEEINEVVNENQELKDQNKYLIKETENISNTAREQHYEDLINQANLFVKLAYVVKQDGYEQRKNEASNVMNDELIERFYPSDTFFQEQVETNIKNEKFYVEKLEPNQKKVDVVIEMEHEMDYLQTDQLDKSKLFVRVTFENTKDKWIATKVEDIVSNTKDTYKENGE
ncbi:hypothetical protein [Virgibacillus salexigens]|uniref:hypothetical protein n=1 Tax=Virgibacillus massiliensis TaxID=1462526 RepID=UPI00136D6A0B|nr:hypothetical protein [Virgibacillus massiliensis]MYL43963.1 hypothetical protein [Virgibacillus massiliensis]